MALNSELVQVATRHQIFLERLKTGAANNFTEVIPEIEEATQEILSLLGNGKVNAVGRATLNTILKQLREEQSKILIKQEKSFIEELNKLAGYESGFEQRALEQQLASALSSPVAVPTAAQAYKVAKNTPLSATGDLLEPFIRKWSNSTINDVNSAVRRAWSEGRTTQQLMQEIRGTRANKFKDGILPGLKKRQAEAVARTSVQHVASRSRMATWEKNSDIVVGYRFIATLDSKTSVVCRTLDQQVFKIGEGPVPPVHINCRSTTVSELPDRFAFLNEGGTRSSKDGPVPAGMTYYEWLKKQPKEFQVEVLGPTRAKMFENMSASKFSSLQLDKNFQPLTLEELSRKEGVTINP